MVVDRKMSRDGIRNSSAGQTSPHTDIDFGAGRLLVINPGTPCDVRLSAHHRQSAPPSVAALNAQSMVIASPQRMTASLEGQRDWKLMDEGDLCCVLAFVDAALNPSGPPASSRSTICCQQVSMNAVDNTAQLGHWLTLQVMQGDPHNELLHHFRRQESYALASYLLRNRVDGAHLNELCVQYGLSYSHFRRLCRRSLGSAIKARMRAWRAARTVLDIIDSDLSILEIAVDNGYTSASHVSSDIKQLFGFTPKAARNARNLLP